MAWIALGWKATLPSLGSLRESSVSSSTFWTISSSTSFPQIEALRYKLDQTPNFGIDEARRLGPARRDEEFEGRQIVDAAVGRVGFLSCE